MHSSVWPANASSLCFPVPLVPAFLIVEEPWLSRFKICHAHCHGKHMVRASTQATTKVENWVQTARSRKIRSTNLMVRVTRDVLIAPIQSTHRTCAKCICGLSHADQHRILYERQNAAAQLEMHMYGFRVILRNTFAPRDLDLEQFVDDRNLFIRVVGEIITEFNMQQPSSAIASYEIGSLGTEEA